MRQMEQANPLTSVHQYILRSPEELQKHGPTRELLLAFRSGRCSLDIKRLFLQELIEVGKCGISKLNRRDYELLAYLVEQGLLWCSSRPLN